MTVSREPCPRCGSLRLIVRTDVVSAHALATREAPWLLRLSLRWRARRTGCRVRCTIRHCELCGYQWGEYTLEQSQPTHPD